jgi:hypothetical protein
MPRLRGLVPALAATLLVGAASPAPAIQPGEQVYSAQLHVHGSLSEGLGSMEWHTDRAVQTGVADVLWWTDHDWRIEHWNHTKRYDFELATVDTANTRVKEPDDAYTNEWRYWDLRTFTGATHEVSIVDSLVYQGTKALRLSTTKMGAGTAFVGVHWAQTGSRLQNRYALAKRVTLHFAVHPNKVNSFSKFVVEATLSHHPGQAHVLRYVMGSSAGETANTIMLPFTDAAWNVYDLDLTADAINLFTSGGNDSLRAEDNDLYEVTIGVETRRSLTQPVVFFDDYRIDTDPSLGGPEMLAKSEDFVELYETMYPSITHFVGNEISRYRAQPHLNSFTPTPALVDYTGTVFSDSIYWAVDQVHALDGVISYNHAWGTSVYGDTSETPQHELARIQAKKRDLIASRMFNCDMMEVGYRVREGIELDDFLSTWDALTANAIFTTGNGVSDSHGTDLFDGWGPWVEGDASFENNFVTWLYATSLDEVGLIQAMRSGRAFFGDPYVFDPDGTLDLWSGEGFPMGRVVLTDRASHEVVVEIDGLPATSTVRFLQAEIRENPPVEYIDPNYLRDEDLTGSWSGTRFTDTVTVDTTLPSFVRVEVEDQGTATAYSNWLAFVTAVPSAGVSGPRVAALLGEAKVVRAEEFTLTGASYTAGPPTVLTVEGDEETAGLGTLEIDTGVLGAPTSVTGGGFTSSTYQNGRLTLVGLSGTGSTVTVEWGGTGAFVPRGGVDRLSLSVGRPNPFGRGTVAEFALPRPSTVFLEVLDVRGRRVRLLLDERRERGAHRVAWDGKDSGGRAVASGVYFLRLTAMGETLTAKAARIR